MKDNIKAILGLLVVLIFPIAIGLVWFDPVIMGKILLTFSITSVEP